MEEKIECAFKERFYLNVHNPQQVIVTNLIEVHEVQFYMDRCIVYSKTGILYNEKNVYII